MTRSGTWETRVATQRADLSALVWRIAENGVLAGIIGATVVAVWFLAVDVMLAGVPFYTPSLLGGVIFAGRGPDAAAGLDGAAVFAYTGLHGVLFLGAGTVLAWMFSQFERNPQVGLVLLLLFVTAEAILWGVGVTLVPALAGVVGAWTILVANVASVAAMFLFLLSRHPRAVVRLRDAWLE